MAEYTVGDRTFNRLSEAKAYALEHGLLVGLRLIKRVT